MPSRPVGARVILVHGLPVFLGELRQDSVLAGGLLADGDRVLAGHQIAGAELALGIRDYTVTKQDGAGREGTSRRHAHP